MTRVPIRIADAIDRLNDRAGRFVSWALVVMVLVQFAIVVARHVFATGSSAAQEAVWYLNGILFMVGGGYTLLHDGHVRLDLFYRDAAPRTQALVDLAGAIVLLIPFCAAVALLSWPYVVQSWAVLESSTEAGGLPAVFLLKTVLLVFAALLGLQGASMAIRAWAVLTGRADAGGRRDRAAGPAI